MRADLDTILDTALAEMRAGASVDECLRRYPEYAAELEPLLRTAVAIRRQTAAVLPPSLDQWLASSRGEIERTARAAYAPPQTLIARLGAALRELYAALVRRGAPRIATAAIATLLICIMVLTGVDVAAAQTLPGDTLYPWKLFSEQTRMRLTFDPDARAELAVMRIERRVAEIGRLTQRSNVDISQYQRSLAELQEQLPSALATLPEASPSSRQLALVRLSRLLDRAALDLRNSEQLTDAGSQSIESAAAFVDSLRATLPSDAPGASVVLLDIPTPSPSLTAPPGATAARSPAGSTAPFGPTSLPEPSPTLPVFAAPSPPTASGQAPPAVSPTPIGTPAAQQSPLPAPVVVIPEPPTTAPTSPPLLTRTPSPTSTLDIPLATSSPTSTPDARPSATSRPTWTPTDTPEPGGLPTDTPEPTQTPTDTPEPTWTPTDTPEPTQTPTDTLEPIDLPAGTPEPTWTPTNTPEPTGLPADTPEPIATPQPTSTPTSIAARSVHPILECVTIIDSSTAIAYFGYRNDNLYPVELPFGPRNYFRPASVDQDQPTVFAPGRTPAYPNAAFSVEFHSSRIVWRLDGRTATASRNSSACPPITQP